MKKTLYIIIVVAGMLIFANRVQAGTISRPVLNTGLVGYWDFQEGKGSYAYDKSGNGFIGALNNMATSSNGGWTDGKIGEALEFDGTDDYVEINNEPELSISSNFTVAAWVRADDLETTNTTLWNTIIAKGDDGETADVNHNYILAYNGNAAFGTVNRWVLSLEDSAGTNCNAVSSAAASTGQWYHVAGVFDDSANLVKIFVNGRLQGQATCALTPNINVRPIQIGDDEHTDGIPWNGKIDEARIYNRALSDGEIERLYKISFSKIGLSSLGTTRINSSQKNRLTDGLVGYWSFDGPDSENAVVFDRSGQGNDGTITGATKAIGKVGQALNFNGSSDYVEITDDTALDLPSSYTISAWVNADTLSRTDVGKWNSIISKGATGETAATNHNYGLMYNGEGDLGTVDRWGLSFENSIGTNCNLVGNAAANTGQWYHVVGVFDDAANVTRIFVDGIQQNQAACALTVNTNNRPVRIGTDEHTSGIPWDGKIDEVRIYNRVLSAEEILRLYNMGR